MLRPFRARGVVLVTFLLAAGCQDYNFNPVGHCLIQPGSKRVTLSNVSSADVLFVVDDSGSMAAEQDALAANFTAFIENLDLTNRTRRSRGLEPFDFHIAVTSSSVFFNFETNARNLGPYTCQASCAGGGGQPVCCRGDNQAVRTAKACTSTSECSAGTTCGPDCISPFADTAALKGENYCCVQGATTIASAYPAGYQGDVVPCSRTGTECGTFERHYNFAGCGGGTSAGVAANGFPYPQGDFVSWSSGATVNPRVLHFDKELYPETPNPAATNRQGFTSQQLQDFFSGSASRGGNVIVGTCGSGEEQALAAAQLAIEKARDGRQRDTYPRTSSQPTWDPSTRIASSPADWFVPGVASKLVVVFVGDEDDCSPTVADPSAAVVWKIADLADGVDSCALDAERAAPLGGKQRPVQSFVDFFTSLGRPVAAGFILPASERTCSLATCTSGVDPADRCCPPTGCTLQNGAQGRGVRLLETAQALAARGVEVVAGSICDPSFGTILNDIAEIVKPPSTLTLPSRPADGDVTLLRIADSSGVTRKLCGRPLAPRPAGETPYTLETAQQTGADWWFITGPSATTAALPAPPVPGVTDAIYINPSGGCIANPGETYSADFLARLPAGGCSGATAAEADETCRRALGGAEGSWTCFAPGAASGQCGLPTAGAPGTCICGGRSDNCSG